mmetsp:Transcript_5996/g.9523  ORF Transcript_5996/g.9523 Transcript_5996/m.9523 type:complete len:110 (-) Transcript_5996:122-451(-)
MHQVNFALCFSCITDRTLHLFIASRGSCEDSGKASNSQFSLCSPDPRVWQSSVWSSGIWEAMKTKGSKAKEWYLRWTRELLAMCSMAWQSIIQKVPTKYKVKLERMVAA